ncbi:MAG TPA: hypothetical protein VJG32_10795 [Anaerolineae bacterium]|nr:hypothetical protein [Anaerolineae bacterium]
MHRLRVQRAGPICLLVALLFFAPQSSAAMTTPHLGYGFNVAQPDSPRVAAIGFNWIKTFNSAPCSPRSAHNVLVRIDVTGHLSLNEVKNTAHGLAASLSGCVEAFEIGNEPNLDASYGWAEPPVAADYTAALCAAYQEIKGVSANFKVISAGLAPTGRVSGNWQGHPGHNGAFQDEREFLKEMIAAGAGNCLDAVGYHPYGFNDPHDTPPDGGACANGFCFRGVEKIYELMQAHGLGGKQVWATEFGWLAEPPAHCQGQPEWAGRLWQIVSEQQQADYLRGAFEYADANWPWMGGMFIFNLDFNLADWYPECEQMRYYGVANRPAETALTQLVKRPVQPNAVLVVQGTSLAAIIERDDQPVTTQLQLVIGNAGAVSLSWTATAAAGAQIVPTLTPNNGTLAAGASQTLEVKWTSSGRALGTYTGAITVSAEPDGTLNTPQTIPVKLIVAQQVHSVYFPITAK